MRCKNKCRIAATLIFINDINDQGTSDCAIRPFRLLRRNQRTSSMTDFSYSTPLSALDAVVLDTETTGLDARAARIVQIGVVHIADGKFVKPAFDTLVNPMEPIPETTSAIHGVTDEMVARAPTFKEVVPELEAFIGHRIVIGHTTSYDLAMLRREYELAGRLWRQPRSLDVGMLARLVAPTLAEHSLDHLCDWLGIEIKGRHTAMGDAEATAKIYIALVPRLRGKDIRTLAEAEAAIRESAETEVRLAGGLAVPVGVGPAEETRPLARIDSFPYRHRVRDVMSAPPLFAPADSSVRDLLQLLLQRKVSSVFVRDNNGETGIVTERDALREIAARGADGLNSMLGAIMSRPLQTVSQDAFIYRAIGRIGRLGFRHLGVRNDLGEIVGAVTPRNLLHHRATTAIMLGDEIESSRSAAELGRAWAKLPAMARSLLAEEVDPRTISAVVSAEIRILTRRAAELAEERMIADGEGKPPVPYAVMVLGSAGRGESLLAADQDNAIVYEVGAAGGPEDRYFERLATHMCAMLDEVGVVLCKGGVMAKYRAWRMSLDDWRATIDSWVRRQRPEDLLNVDIFFDGITVHGDLALGEAAWNHAWDRGHNAPDFLKLLTEVARERGMPFTVFGNLRVDERGRIDLKRTGLMPIFTSARVLSIRHDVRARSTPERLAGVAAKGIGAASDMEAIIEAHKIILGVMLAQQLLDIETGIPPSSKVAPDHLDRKERASLRKALGKVDAVIDLVGEGLF